MENQTTPNPLEPTPEPTPTNPTAAGVPAASEPAPTQAMPAAQAVPAPGRRPVPPQPAVATPAQGQTAAQPARYATPTTQLPQAAQTTQYAAPRGAYQQTPQATAAQATTQRAYQQMPRRSTARKSNSLAASFLTALLGAILGAGLLFVLLNARGAFNKTASVASSPTESSAGPTITINASEQDATISKAVAAKALPSVVSIYVTTDYAAGVGSGVILDTEGNVLTNYHVIEDAATISVTIDGKSYDGEVVGGDESSDLAVVKVDLQGDSVTPMEIGDSSALVVGDWVMAIGSPYGLDQSVSTGIVSSLYRSTMLPTTTGNTIYANLIQTDAAINPGNSGGALVNDKGQLVGINSIIESESGANAGIGFAIAGNYAVSVAKTIIAGDPVLHPYIGLSLQTVTAQNARQAGLSVNQGAYVAEVTNDGPGKAAGIQEGDVIIKLGNQNIISADALILAVRSHEVGETVSVELVRGEEHITIDVTLGDDAPLQALQQQQQQGDQGYSLGDLFGWGAPEGGNGYGNEG